MASRNAIKRRLEQLNAQPKGGGRLNPGDKNQKPFLPRRDPRMK